jgi:hypothetical protein
MCCARQDRGAHLSHRLQCPYSLLHAHNSHALAHHDLESLFACFMPDHGQTAAAGGGAAHNRAAAQIYTFSRLQLLVSAADRPEASHLVE